ncbi:type II toxin-antitoxin system Phd/YefM family antitoxin [Candidatus Gottesmanbacteria bacterium]|nr:type II toxin-antitoxin system Phd/YefM family antitoxin [Candidatus Gottesmanbacteria bacterium]
MDQIISKSQFKPHVLEYLRLVEKEKKPLVITHGGKPVVQILPFSKDPKKELEALRGTVVKYRDPSKPVGLDDWEILK